MRCLDLEQIEELASNGMDATGRSMHETHLASCADCRKRLDEVRDNMRIAARVAAPHCGDDATAAAAGAETASSGADIAISPDSFPGYQILREISRGGQGVVYQAIQQSTKRKVAIKVLRDGRFADSSERARFEREVQILGQLKHSNIVSIYDSGSVSGNAFYVMDYVSGKPLDEYVEAEGPRDEGTKRRRVGSKRSRARGIKSVLELFAKVCDAVHEAHLKGIIHRDLKPSNIRVDTNGEPHVLDFGLAKLAGAAELSHSPAMTMTGQFLGSLPWSSPEQAEGQPSKIDIRTDVYSLGVILYQLLTSCFPYEVTGNMRDVLDRIMHAEPIRPSLALRPSAPSSVRASRFGIDDEVETIVRKCLRKERERRYQSAGELARDIRHYLTGEPIEAKRDSGWYVLRKHLHRYRVVAYVASIIVLLVSASAITSTVLWRRAVSAEKEQSRERQRAEMAAHAEAEERAVAVVEKQRADQERDIAKEQRVLAVARELEARRFAYMLAIKTAHQAWKASDVANMIKTLEAVRPRADEGDIRGFEWHYLWGVCHAERLTLDCVGSVLCVALSSDGRYAATGYSGTPPTALLWDAHSGSRVVECAAPSELASLNFTSDGRHLIGDSARNAAFRTEEYKQVSEDSDSECVIAWEVPSGREVLRLDKQGFVALTADGATLVTRSANSSLRVLEFPTGRERAVLRGHTLPIRSVSVSPDGKRLASASNGYFKLGSPPSEIDTVIRLWDLSSGAELYRIDAQHGVTCLTFAPDGSLLVSGDNSGNVRIWDVSTGGERVVWSQRTIGVSAVSAWTCPATSPVIGSYLATGGTMPEVVEVRQLAPFFGKGIPRNVAGRLAAVCEPTDYILVGTSPRVVGAWSPTGPSELLRTAASTVAIHSRDVTCLTYSSDGQSLLTGSLDGEAKLWDLRVPIEWGGLKFPWLGEYAAVSGDGRVMATVSAPFRGAKSVIRNWDTETGRELASMVIESKSFPSASALSFDGCTFAAVLDELNPDRELIYPLHVWNVATGTQSHRILSPATTIRRVCISPDGNTLAAVLEPRDSTSRDVDELWVWDLSTGASRLLLKGSLGRLLFSPDGRIVMTCARGALDETILFDATTGAERMRIPAAWSASYSPDGLSLATGSVDGIVRIWDMQDGRRTAEFRGSSRSSPSANPKGGSPGPPDFGIGALSASILAFSPDGKKLVLSSGSRFGRKEPCDALLHDLESQAESVTLKGHQETIMCAAFSPDGARIATGSTDGTVRIWDSATGQELICFDDHRQVHEVRFIRAGKTLLSAGLGGHHLSLRSTDRASSTRVKE